MGDLVVGPLQEGRVDADDGAQTALGQSSRESDGVRFSDADVEESFREMVREIGHAGAAAHGGRDDHHALVFLGQFQDGLGNGVGVGRVFLFALFEFARRGIEFSDAVVAFGIVLGGLVAFALRGAAVQNDRHDLLLGAGFKDAHQLFYVVAVHRADVVEAHLLENVVDDEEELEGAKKAHGKVGQMLAHDGDRTEGALDASLELTVAHVGDEPGEMFGNGALGGRNRHGVVVEDYREAGAGGVVVEGLQGHAAR